MMCLAVDINLGRPAHTIPRNRATRMLNSTPRPPTTALAIECDAGVTNKSHTVTANMALCAHHPIAVSIWTSA